MGEMDHHFPSEFLEKMQGYRVIQKLWTWRKDEKGATFPLAFENVRSWPGQGHLLSQASPRWLLQALSRATRWLLSGHDDWPSAMGSFRENLSFFRVKNPKNDHQTGVKSEFTTPKPKEGRIKIRRCGGSASVPASVPNSYYMGHSTRHNMSQQTAVTHRFVELLGLPSTPP